MAIAAAPGLEIFPVALAGGGLYFTIRAIIRNCTPMPMEPPMKAPFRPTVSTTNAYTYSCIESNAGLQLIALEWEYILGYIL